MRKATVKRTTKETDVAVTVDLDGRGEAAIATGIGFLDHMLDLLARHSRIDMMVKASGDLHIDHHHTTEDVGIALGQAVKQALGDMRASPATPTCTCRWTRRSPASPSTFRAGLSSYSSPRSPVTRSAPSTPSSSGSGFRPSP